MNSDSVFAGICGLQISANGTAATSAIGVKSFTGS